jgi:alcohol dehydrogenase/S-(hydroxymethyl)glutathione dehydrogenase/alcohol dehydrogenase
MRAAVFNQSGRPLDIVDGIEIDDPRPGEVLVRIRHCGVCHSDLSIIDGALPYPVPAILGHEASGTIAALGPGVTGLAEGASVVLSMRPPCGHCYWCVRNESVLCAETAGPPGSGEPRTWHAGKPITRGFRLGAFAEYALVEASGVAQVPDAVPLDAAAVVGCAIQTGIGSVTNVAKTEPGATAAVIGLGGVGLAVIQGLVLSGAATIVGIDPVAERRERAIALGATVAFASRDADLSQRVLTATGRIGCDYVFDTVSSTQTTQLASAILRAGGKVVLIGVTGEAQPLGMSSMDLVMRQKSVVGSFLGNCHSQRDLPKYLTLCSAGRLDLKALVTAIRPLSEINIAMAELRAGKGVRTVLSI